jgi:hypothetical protein
MRKSMMKAQVSRYLLAFFNGIVQAKRADGVAIVRQLEVEGTHFDAEMSVLMMNCDEI